MIPIIVSLLVLFSSPSTLSANASVRVPVSHRPLEARIIPNTAVKAASGTARARRSVTRDPIVAPQPAPVPAPSPLPAPPQSSPTTYASQVEMLVLTYTNNERMHAGLSLLSFDTRLADIARTHSADMLAKNYFSHNDLSGCSPACRLNRAGYAWQSYGENIHWMNGYTLTADEAARKIVTDWMNSAPHRANILSATFTKAGVGVAVSGTKIYSTTDYALPR